MFLGCLRVLLKRSACLRSILTAVLSILLGSVLLLLAGCAASNTSIPPHPPDSSSLVVSFTSATSYAQALRLITDVGLQPGINCGSFQGGQRRVGWQPMGQREAFAQTHQMIVWLAGAPVDWGERLEASPDVLMVQAGSPEYPTSGARPSPPAGLVPYSCPPSIDSLTPSPGTPVALGVSEIGLNPYIHVTFASPLATYDAALYVVSDLGLRLADPCFEAAYIRADSAHKPPWRPRGQENAFAATQQLMLC